MARAGPGWQAAAGSLALALLWLCPPALCARPTATTVAGCGKPAVTGKIFGGENAPEQRWPWQASLLYSGTHICGAALIDAYWVISAAHCFQKSSRPSDYQILLGYHKLTQPTKHSLLVTVHRLIVHSDFNKHYFMGRDIALLQLHQPVTFTSHILPACLPGPKTNVTPGTTCWITGWGMVTEDEFLAKPLQLQQAQLGVMDNEVCKMYFQPPESNGSAYSVHEDMLCAGNLLTGKSICRGDSGGPLVCELNSTWFLIGLSSWSAPCHQPISPSIFTRLTYFSNWISEKQTASPNPDPSLAPPQPKPPALNNFNATSLGTVHKPRNLAALVFAQTLPLLLVSLGAL